MDAERFLRLTASYGCSRIMKVIPEIVGYTSRTVEHRSCFFATKLSNTAKIGLNSLSSSCFYSAPLEQARFFGFDSQIHLLAG